MKTDTYKIKIYKIMDGGEELERGVSKDTLFRICEMYKKGIVAMTDRVPRPNAKVVEHIY